MSHVLRLLGLLALSALAGIGAVALCLWIRRRVAAWMAAADPDDVWVPPRPVPERTLAAFFARERAQRGDPGPHGELAHVLWQRLEQAARRLNSLPAEDPYWETAPRPRPEAPKAPYRWPAFVVLRHFLDTRPPAETDPWALAALDVLVHGTFSARGWKELGAADARNVRWIVEAARVVFLRGGSPTDSLLRDTLREIGRLDGAFQEKLAPLTEDPERALAAAARQALDLLSPR